MEFVRRDRDRLSLRLVGELDIAASTWLRTGLASLPGQGVRRLEVNVVQLSFCDVGGARVLKDLHEHLRGLGGGLVLVGGGMVRRVLELAWPQDYPHGRVEGHPLRVRGGARPRTSVRQAAEPARHPALERADRLKREASLRVEIARQSSALICLRLAQMHESLASLHAGLGSESACRHLELARGYRERALAAG
ncbi:STAS domain-containing protein [Nonomuraea sp. NPDC050663]|uniref:STAS domain-containing protein n=1 Tax=Nonomuraea sp. NPDC050663 TaxID=3364370 RepID=UPI003798394A